MILAHFQVFFQPKQRNLKGGPKEWLVVSKPIPPCGTIWLSFARGLIMADGYDERMAER
jgi:hypothetical protein